MSQPSASATDTETHTVTMHFDFDDEVELSKHNNKSSQEAQVKQAEIISTFARTDEDGQIDESQKIKHPIHLTFFQLGCK